MANFLDSTGLAHLWEKILAKISAKKVNQIEPLSKNLDTSKVTRLSTGNINTTTDTIGTLQTFQATATMKATADGSYPDVDSNVMMMNWDSTAGYSTQLAQRNITGEIRVRGQNKKTWTAWRTVLDSTNKDDYLTDYAKAADIPTATSALTNDSGYITDSALSNYYTKTEDDTALAGKVAKAGDTMSGELTISKSSGDTYFHAKRTDKGNEVWFGVGSAGVNRGVYDGTLKKWLFHTDGTTTFTNGNINIGQVQEWGNASFTYSDGFAAYSTVANNTQEPRACKWGRIVNLTGAYKTTEARTATSSVVIGKVPSGCEPLNDVRVRQQGTGQNSYLLTVGKNGNLTAERYGVATNTAIPNNVWLNINATYISKS